VFLQLFCIYLFDCCWSQVWNKPHCHCHRQCTINQYLNIGQRCHRSDYVFKIFSPQWLFSVTRYPEQSFCFIILLVRSQPFHETFIPKSKHTVATRPLPTSWLRCCEQTTLNNYANHFPIYTISIFSVVTDFHLSWLTVLGTMQKSVLFLNTRCCNALFEFMILLKINNECFSVQNFGYFYMQLPLI